MSVKSDKFIKKLDNFIDYYVEAKKHKPEVVEIKQKDRNLMWPLMRGDKYRDVFIRFVK
jgi:hypothetical protein